jgi:hypothetical protein
MNINNVTVTTPYAGTHKFSGEFASSSGTVANIGRDNNKIDLDELEVGNDFVIDFGPVSTSSDLSVSDIIDTNEFSGVLHKVELIEVAGAISGVVSIGNSASVTAYLSQDLSAITVTRGKADLAVTTGSLRASDRVSLRLSGTSSTTGTFKVRLYFTV